MDTPLVLDDMTLQAWCFHISTISAQKTPPKKTAAVQDSILLKKEMSLNPLLKEEMIRIVRINLQHTVISHYSSSAFPQLLINYSLKKKCVNL